MWTFRRKFNYNELILSRARLLYEQRGSPGEFKIDIIRPLANLISI